MSVARTDERRVRARQLAHQRKQLGLVFATLPFVAFAILAIGEAARLEPGWWSHLLEVGAVALVAWAAWTRPRIGGPLLFVVGAVFTALITLYGNGTFAENLIPVGIFFAPLIVAGVFFTLAGYETRERRPAHPSPEP